MQATDLDPYETLGVHCAATLEEIKTAYRARVMKCHPDKGGTHEEMVAVAAAWQILSDPATRAQYDAARELRDDRRVQAQWEQTRESARAQAESYAETWEALWRHMDKVARDVQGAEYGSSDLGFGYKTTTVANSFSGSLLVGAATVVGLSLYVYIIVSRFGGVAEIFQYKHKIGLLLGAAAVISISSWAGHRLHRALRDLLRRRAGIVIDCERCGKHLRIPDLNARSEVTCPECRSVFAHEPDWKAKAQRLQERLDVTGKDRKILAVVALLAVVGCFLILKISIEAARAAIVERTAENMRLGFDIGYGWGYADSRRGAPIDSDGAWKMQLEYAKKDRETRDGKPAR